MGEDSALKGGSAPKQDRSRVTRRRLLESAVRCLANHGWEVSTVAFIAAEAGISRGAVKSHASRGAAALRELLKGEAS